MERRGEQGYALIAVVVMVFLVMLALGVAAPTIAKQLHRENEVEAMHRGDQYTRAIRVFYRKNGGHYPSSIEQMEKTNNVRYLRQRYVDPMTGKDDWRLIHLGENKTTVKGFFGQPLAGIATSNIGSSQGLSTPGTPIAAQSSAIGGTAGASGSTSGFGQSSGSGFGSSPSAFGGSASSGFGASSATNAAAGAGAGLGAVRALLAARPVRGLGHPVRPMLRLAPVLRLAGRSQQGREARLLRRLRVRSPWGLGGRLWGLGPGLRGTRSWI
jgi:type II secretory pathway pseudopilin PulG